MKKTVASSVTAPATGNAIAYFGLWWLGRKYGYTFDDPELAMAMGGALVATLLFELRRLGSGVVYIFNRIYPPEKVDNNDTTRNNE